eukprot:scaffold39515_cov176-Amphora_coffeaeformis.AAC.2
MPCRTINYSAFHLPAPWHSPRGYSPPCSSRHHRPLGCQPRRTKSYLRHHRPAGRIAQSIDPTWRPHSAIQ